MLSRDTARLFLALWPPAAVCESLLAHARQWQLPPSARPTAGHRLHVTLHFMGNVPATRLDELRAALHVPCEPFTVDFTQPALWKGGLAVLLARTTPAQLQNLHGQLAARLRELSLPVDNRPLRPHVTLARHAGGAVAPPQAAVRWPAMQGYALVQTLPTGAYRNLHSFKCSPDTRPNS